MTTTMMKMRTTIMTTIKFDNFEVHPVVAYDDTTGEPFNLMDDPDRHCYCEQVYDITPELEPFVFYSLYGHIPDEGIDCIADFRCEKDAEYACTMLNEALSG